MKLIDKLMARRSAGAQAGFTMVELAIVLVVAGLILVAALKGTDMIGKAKVERSVADLKGLQGMIMEYQKRTGRLPGDCNNDGKIGFGPDVAAYPTALLDATEANRILPTTAVDFATTPAIANCVASGSGEGGDNIVWNDMRRNNIVDPQRLPRELAKNASGSYYAVGNMTGAIANNNANVIVVYSIPVWMAEAIDASIDGSVTYAGAATTGVAATDISAANTGRVRRWDGNMTGTSPAIPVFAPIAMANGFAKGTETRDSIIAISFQFDGGKLPN
jgi:prepilin-type N-terminal cleavage/methylation domain-containing protein